MKMPGPAFFKVFTNTASKNNDAFQKACNYKYTIDWSHGDRQFAARCPEFPDLFYLAGTREQALDGAKRRVAKVLKDS